MLASGSDDRSLRLWAMPPAVAGSASSSASNGGSSKGSQESSSGSLHASNGTAAGAAALELQPQRVLWGHASKLYDFCFGGAGHASSSGGIGSSGSSNSGSRSGVSSSDGASKNSGSHGSSFLVTASGDCTLRVWCLASGAQLAAIQVRVRGQQLQLLRTALLLPSLPHFRLLLQGHSGRGIWRCALLEPRPQQPAACAAAAAARCFVLTGGADSAIKCWRLADWLPSAVPVADVAAPQLSPAAVAAQCFALRGTPPDPAAVEVGRAVTPTCEPALSPTAVAGTWDSRSEWVRQLALASCGASDDGGRASQMQPWRRRWLYVATNQGLLHRVRLPGEALTARAGMAASVPLVVAGAVVGS